VALLQAPLAALTALPRPCSCILAGLLLRCGRGEGKEEEGKGRGAEEKGEE